MKLINSAKIFLKKVCSARRGHGRLRALIRLPQNHCARPHCINKYYDTAITLSFTFSAATESFSSTIPKNMRAVSQGTLIFYFPVFSAHIVSPKILAQYPDTQIKNATIRIRTISID